MAYHKKIMILDPSPVFSETLKEVIQTSEPQLEVTETADWKKAKTILRRDGVDVVFMDVAIPISVKTVEKHRANLIGKLDLHNVAQLTAYAIKKGLVEPKT